MATPMVQSAVVKIAWGIVLTVKAKREKTRVSKFIENVTGRFKRMFDFVDDKTKRGRDAVKKQYDRAANTKLGQDVKKQYDVAIEKAKRIREKLKEMGLEDVDADELEKEERFKTSSTDPPNMSFGVTTKSAIHPVKFGHMTKEQKEGLEDEKGNKTTKGWLKGIFESLVGEKGKDGVRKAPNWMHKVVERENRRKMQVEAEKEAVKARLGKDKGKGKSWIGKLFSNPLMFFVGLYLLPFRLIGKFLFGKLGEKVAWAVTTLVDKFKLIVNGAVRWLFDGVALLWRKFSTALGTGLKNLGQAVWNRRPKWMKDAWSKIKENWELGKEWRRQYFRRLGVRFKMLKKGIGRQLGKLGNKISEKLGWLGGKMKGWFHVLGIQLSKLGDKIAGSKTWGKIKNIFGKGGRVGSWIARVAPTVIRVAGAVLSGPVGWAIAVGMALWGAYSLYKYFKGDSPRFPDSPAGRISQLRMYAYGLSMTEGNKYVKMFELEEIIGKFMRREDDGTVTLMDVDQVTQKQIGDIFDVDFDVNDGEVEVLNRWLRERFFPVYREFLRVLWNQDKSKKPGELDGLNRRQLATIAYLFDPPGKIWDFKHLPFKKPRKSKINKSDFLELQKTVQNELSIEWEAVQNKLSSEEKIKARNINEQSKKKTELNVNDDTLKEIDKKDRTLSKSIMDIIDPDESRYKTIDEQIDELMEKEGQIPPDGIKGPKQIFFLRAGNMSAQKEGRIVGFTIKDNGDPFNLEEYWTQYVEDRGGKADMDKFRQHVKEAIEKTYATERMSVQGFYLPSNLVPSRRGTRVDYVSPEYEKKLKELEAKKQAIRDAAAGNYVPTKTNVKVDLDALSNYSGLKVKNELVGPVRSKREVNVFGSNVLTSYGYYDDGFDTPFNKTNNRYNQNKPYGGLLNLPDFETKDGDPNILFKSGADQYMGYGIATPPPRTGKGWNADLEATVRDGDPNGIGSLSLDDVFKLGAEATGVPEPILWAFAKLESSLNPAVKAPGDGNSATGLLQMTNKAWDTMIQWHGKKYGLTKANANRYNPLHNVLLGAEFIKGNMKAINGYKEAGIDLPTALYLAHFFGPGGVQTFLTNYRKNPDIIIDKVLPSAVDSNPKELKGKSLRQVLEEQRAKIHQAMGKPAEEWSGYIKLKQLFPNLYRNPHPGDRPTGDLMMSDKINTKTANEALESQSVVGRQITEGDVKFNSLMNLSDNSQSFVNGFTNPIGNNGGSFSQLMRDMNLTDTGTGFKDQVDMQRGDSLSSMMITGNTNLKDYAGEKEILGMDYGKAETLAISVHPIKAGYPFYFTSLFGPRNTGIPGASTTHKGVDIGVPSKKAGTPIVATGPGKVGRAYRSKSYGLVVYLYHKDGYQTRYAHLDKLLVREGQEVEAGDLVGLMGNTGVGSGVHLHFEVRRGHGQWDTAVDPFSFAIIKNSFKGLKVPTVIEENGKIQSDANLTEEKQQQSMLMTMGIEPPDSLSESLLQKDPVTGEYAYKPGDDSKENPDNINDASNVDSSYNSDDVDKTQEVKVDVDVKTSSLEKSLDDASLAIRDLIATISKLSIPGSSSGGNIKDTTKETIKEVGDRIHSSFNNDTQPSNGSSIRASQAIRFDSY